MGKKNDKEKSSPKFSAQLSMEGEVATLTVAGFIGWDTEAVAFTDKVRQAKESGASTLVVRINSLGGYCYDGLAMGDCLKNCGMTTRGEVYGTAQSMASYLLQCCTERTAHQHATLMFHQPSAGVYGTVDELLEQAQYLVKMRDQMFEDMAARCGTTGPELSAEHMSMKIYTAEEALAKGFLDRIEGEGEATEEVPEVATEATASGKRWGLVDYGACMRMAMAGEEEAEEASEEAAEEATEEAAEEVTEEASEETSEETSEKRGEPAEENDLFPEEEKATEKAEASGEKPLTRAEVAAMICKAQAEAAAAYGAPAEMLPGMSGGTVAKEYTMEELDAMPAMQRLAVLGSNPRLAAKYARH